MNKNNNNNNKEDQSSSSSSCQSHSNIISNIYKRCREIPDQRTPEWFKYKKMRIGGSEMYNVCKLNKNNVDSFINNFLFNKIDRVYKFIAPCEFGNLFEDEIQCTVEKKYKTKIYNFGVIQYDKLKSVCYSPDGIGIVNNKVILFEFKCPYTRIPSDTIKYDYQCQINTGLNVINECEEAYYCEGEFKKCKLEDLFNYEVFDTDFHNILLNRDFNKLYNTYGLIYIYQINKNNNFLVSKCSNIKEEINPYNKYNTIDIGNLNKKDFVDVLYKIHKKEYKIVYFNDLIKNKIITDDILEKYKDLLPYNDNKKLITKDLLKIIQNAFETYINKKNGKTVGYIPWKLYNYNMILHNKKKEFFNDDLKCKLSYIGYVLNHSSTLNVLDEKKEYIKKSILKLNLSNEEESFI